LSDVEPSDVEALAARYRAVGSAAVFGALEASGAPMRLFSLDVRPIDRGQIVAGPAYTLKAVRDPRPHHTGDMDPPKMADYAMFRAMTPGCVIVADPGAPDVGFWGDLMSAASYTSGARGIVIDGCARDTRFLLAMPHFPVFCRNTTMSSTERRVNTIDFQIPIAVGGAFERQVDVVPGDWIYGDMDGVVAIPAQLAESVLRAAEEAEERETLIRRDFDAGQKVWDVYPKHRRL
jgi:4-hydroxy-4-methyl-2-oxoglutarate aldolase